MTKNGSKGEFGTGITAKPVILYDIGTDEGREAVHSAFLEWQKQVATHGGAFAAVVNPIKETCTGILTDAEPGPEPPHSKEDFARTICEALWNAFDRISENDADNAAHFAFHAGIMWAEANMKWQFEKDVLDRWKAKKSLAYRNEGRDQHNKERKLEAAQWQALAIEIAKETEMTGNKQAAWVANALQRRHGIRRNPKTVAKALRK
ncbi:hypothetical protein ROJ8625_00940 [Roseivivax jejudonensis]|uniref:Uncharacterized protein n=1 Tax=Roseivivax jejudonensis TaxID=1529041 RepID=A0A1X6YKC4_9RHOB|nr:hypothetical protein [Roseivivax jejudonensis]SLN23388.1 hypothetical protein ROJ8625_00940 [Roseivivax jejudonensis]